MTSWRQVLRAFAHSCKLCKRVVDAKMHYIDSFPDDEDLSYEVEEAGGDAIRIGLFSAVTSFVIAHEVSQWIFLSFFNANRAGRALSTIWK